MKYFQKQQNNKVLAKLFTGMLASILVGSFMATSFSLPAQANDKDAKKSKNDEPDFILDTSNLNKNTGGVISSEQFLELGQPTPSCYRLEGESSLRYGNLDRAILVLQRSVEMAPLDMDNRILYAEALERKLHEQKIKDPKLFNFVIKQWLFIAKKAEFPDQSVQGYGHLSNLTGRVPGRFEKPGKYLAKVLIPEDSKEKVVIGGSKGKMSKKNSDDFLDM